VARARSKSMRTAQREANTIGGHRVDFRRATSIVRHANATLSEALARATLIRVVVVPQCAAAVSGAAAAVEAASALGVHRAVADPRRVHLTPRTRLD